MNLRKCIAVIAAMALFLAAAGTASAAKGPPPKRATIKAVSSLKVKINRYIQDKLRWQKDTYQVRAGGTLKVVQQAPDDGPHTFTVVKKGDLPRTVKELFNCEICNTLGQAHGADPNSEAPPQFLFLENGVGQDTTPNVDGAGDSAFIGPDKGTSVTLPVTAKKGSTLRFLCLIHPWMQAKVLVR